MPNYHMMCSSCQIEYQVRRSIHDGPPKTCEQCGGEIGQVYHPPEIIGDPRTLGMLADRNTSKLGMHERENLFREQEEKRKKLRPAMDLPEGMQSLRPLHENPKPPWWRKRGQKGPNLKLAELAPQQVGDPKKGEFAPLSKEAVKYIEEGKK